MPHPVIWGFPSGYDPNAFADRCDRCHRSGHWISKPTKAPDCAAWICQACTSWPPPFGSSPTPPAPLVIPD